MGKKGSWFRSMKKVMSSDPKEPKEPKDQGKSKTKKKWFGKSKASDPIPRQAEPVVETTITTTTPPPVEPPPPIQPPPPVQPPPPPPPAQDSQEESIKIEEMRIQHTSSIAIATAKAAEAAMVAAQAAAELARLTTTPRLSVKLSKEAAAVRIQTFFRAYTARRTLRVLRGLARLEVTMQGQSVKRQTANALKCMQTLVRVQSEIRARRLRTTEENQARQKQLLDKHGKEPAAEQERGRNQKGESSCILLQPPGENFTKPAQTMFMESINPHWGWSWLERWLAEKPWENASPMNPDLAPLRSSLNASPSGSQIAKALLYHVTEKQQQSHSAASSPRSSVHSARSATAPRQRISTGRLSTSSTPRARVPARARGSPKRGAGGNDDAMSVQSDQNGRRSNAVDADNESLASSPAVGAGSAVIPNYMAPTESARARSRVGSPNSADRMSASSGRRRGSYPSSPARSRHSTSSITDGNSVGDGK